jgi:hypothetical protein
MPFAHGILATHSIWNFLMLSHDFFATLPLVDFSSYKVGRIEIGQIDNRRIWFMVLKILQPSSSRKKRKRRGIKNSRRKRNNWIRHTNRTKRRNGIRNQQKKTLDHQNLNLNNPQALQKMEDSKPL